MKRRTSQAQMANVLNGERLPRRVTAVKTTGLTVNLGWVEKGRGSSKVEVPCGTTLH